MRVAVVQTNPLYLKVDKNLQEIEKLVNSVKADLFVLPELCSSGYNFQSKRDLSLVAENARTGKTAKLLSKMSKRKNAAIVAGIPEVSNGKYFNSALIIRPGKIDVYRKCHLFFNEKKYFNPGKRKPNIFTHKGIRFGVLICFDWFFPELSRLLALKGAQILAHPSNLVMPYAPKGMAIRSLENLVYSVTSNRVGEEFGLRYIGKSQVLDTRGKILTRLSNRRAGVSVVSLNAKMADNKNLNKLNNVFKDRIPSLYKI